MEDCTICYGAEASHRFACGHTLCQGCLERLAMPTCPFCRSPVDVPDSVHARSLAVRYATEDKDAAVAYYLSVFPTVVLETLYSAMDAADDPWDVVTVHPKRL